MRKQNTGLLALGVIGAYFLWKNRFEVQKALQSIGIDTPLLGRNLSETVRSGVARIKGQANQELGSGV